LRRVSSMSEENVLSGRVEQATISLPASTEEAYDPQPKFRVVLDVSWGRSLGLLQKGYYMKINDTIYYIAKQSAEAMTNTQTEKVLEFLKKTQAMFTIAVYNENTISGHQFLAFHDITCNTMLYALKDYRVFRGLWQTIEGELFENKYSPSIARFTDSRLIWYVKLIPENSLKFTQVATISLSFVDNQGHLQIYRITKDERFAFPGYLYSARQSFRMFNHVIHQTVDVIPLGSERRIISLSKETQITSEDHDPITLPQGQYLLFHPRPRVGDD
jgi:hypothetical protein